MDLYSLTGRRRLQRRKSVRPQTGEPVRRRLQRRPPSPEARDCRERTLTPSQVRAIRAVMRIFVDDDLANGVPPGKQLYCRACEQYRPAAGFIQYGRLTFCNDCAIDYEIARARGLLCTPEEFLRQAEEARLAPALAARSF